MFHLFILHQFMSTCLCPTCLCLNCLCANCLCSNCLCPTCLCPTCLCLTCLCLACLCATCLYSPVYVPPIYSVDTTFTESGRQLVSLTQRRTCAEVTSYRDCFTSPTVVATSPPSLSVSCRPTSSSTMATADCLHSSLVRKVSH